MAELAATTLDWMSQRLSKRLLLANALLGGDNQVEDSSVAMKTLGEVQGDTSPVIPVEEGGQVATPYACELNYNDGFENIFPDPYPDPVEGGLGWPNSKPIVDAFLSVLRSGDGASPDEVVALLQINTLDAFRRTLLRERQRKVHALRHAQYVAAQLSVQSAELGRLLLASNIQTNTAGGAG